jgi:hypothetical protein
MKTWLGVAFSVVLVACGPKASGPAPSGPGAPSGAPAVSGAIEASCTFRGADLEGEPGATFHVVCPAGCSGSSLWGTEVYTGDSPVCEAAVHAGAIPATGGTVTVRLEPGLAAYRGSTRYGIKSNDYGSYDVSYAVVGAVAPAAGSAPSAGPIQATCTFPATDIPGEAGSTHLVVCPTGCASAVGGIWGTDVYTADSPVCKAAIHAGLLQDAQGGTVSVTLVEGRPAYRGSARNGVTTNDYGAFASSYTLARP